MKALTAIIIFLLCCSQLNAQSNHTIVAKPPSKNALAQPFFFTQKTNIQDSISPLDHMTIAGVHVPRLNYIGNNGSGLDVYQSTPDNMFVLKPDSSFHSAMPTGNYSLQFPGKPSPGTK